ncbi:hypothetical protein [Chryseolinea soli]|nr:hypothetical protein [Chryseolinea soli]
MMKYLFLMLMTSGCCHFIAKADVPSVVDTVMLHEAATGARVVRVKDSLHIKKVKIVEYKKKVDHASVVYPEYDKQCAGWRLSEKQLEKTLVKSYIITEHEVRFFFTTIPCHYEGVAIVNDGPSMRFEVNAGSYSVFYEDLNAYYLGYFGAGVDFIEPPGIAVDVP